MAKRMIIKGVGMFMAKRVGSYGEEVVTLGTLQDLKIDLSVEIEDIFGGDGMFAIDTLVKSKNIEVTATDAKLDLNAISLMLGSGIVNDDDYLWVLNEGQTITSAAGATKEKFLVTITGAPSTSANLGITIDGATHTVAVLDTDSTSGVATKLSGMIALLPTGSAPFDYTVTPHATIADAFWVESALAGYKTDAVALSAGASGVTYTVGTTVQGAAASAATDELGFTPYTSNGVDAVDPEIAVRIKATNQSLIRVYPVASWVPADAGALGNGDFVYYATDNKIYTNGTHGGEAAVVNYKREAAGIDILSILADEIPFPVSVIHHGSFMQKDGTFQGIETELFACIAKGTYSINAQRATASANTVTLAIVDPERADGRIGTIKRYSASTKV